jgi:hypothetical protein
MMFMADKFVLRDCGLVKRRDIDVGLVSIIK